MLPTLANDVFALKMTSFLARYVMYPWQIVIRERLENESIENRDVIVKLNIPCQKFDILASFVSDLQG